MRSTPARVVLALIAFALVAPGILHAAPQLGGADHSFVVLSGSMAPLLQPGDVIFVREVAPDSLMAGDVVTFRAHAASSTLITHRVIERLDEGGVVRYRTQGDANEDPDPFVVRQDMVVGAHLYTIPAWGLLIDAVRSTAGYVLFVLLPASAIILREMVKLYHELDALDRVKRQEARP